MRDAIIAGMILAITIGGGGILLSCRATNAQPPKQVDKSVDAAESDATDATARRVDPNEVTQADPCAARLHEIAGAMLMYYALNKNLPDRLDELQSLADAGTTLDFNCPLSRMPYVYVANGLRADGKTKLIILHDAAASHDGTRWCILQAGAQPGAARSLEVLRLPEGVFRLYR